MFINGGVKNFVVGFHVSTGNFYVWVGIFDVFLSVEIATGLKPLAMTDYNKIVTFLYILFIYALYTFDPPLNERREIMFFVIGGTKTRASARHRSRMFLMMSSTVSRREGSFLMSFSTCWTV